MKFITSIILTGILGFILCLYLPWWSLAIGAFVVAVMIFQKPWHSFLSAFLGIFILWFVFASVVNTSNNGLLSQKVASIFPLGGSAFLLILVTAIVGAMVAGLAALSGRYLRNII